MGVSEIPKEVWGLISALCAIIIALVGILHKDMTKRIDKLADLLTPLFRQVDRHEIKIEEHAKKHDEHAAHIERHRDEINTLKKNMEQQKYRIDKIEDRI